MLLSADHGMGVIPNLPCGPSIFTRILKMWRREEEESVSERFKVKKTQRAVIGLDDGRGPPVKDSRQPLEAGKGKEMDSFFPRPCRRKTDLDLAH